MTCCGGNTFADQAVTTSMAAAIADKAEELKQYAVKSDNGDIRYIFACPQIHCGSCVANIEKQLAKNPEIKSLRVNLTLRRITLDMVGDASPLATIRTLGDMGYDAVPLDFTQSGQSAGKKQAQALLRALAVAGFATMNIMLLSVSNWSGADGPTRDLFHLISVLIAVPAVAFSGQVFFKSAYKALRQGHLNMDVPISLAVLMALAMSIFETFNHGEEVYFDAAVSLLFFLLIGRYLDQIMREKARNALDGLARLSVRGANVIVESGLLEYRPLDEIPVGSRLRIGPGERIPLDGEILSGVSDFDLSIITGESELVTLGGGGKLMAGTMNVTAGIVMVSTSTAEKSYLAEVTRMLMAAENGRGRYVQLADRMARLYAPAVHLLAFLAFLYWMVVTGGDWHTSIYVAVAVLIVTCPCALGLAVPVVHVIGAGRLFEQGILMRDGAALERLSEINHVVFDKTGTLTREDPIVTRSDFSDPSMASRYSALDRALAKTLAMHSSHPSAKAIFRNIDVQTEQHVTDITEIPGCGIEGMLNGSVVRLGKPDWVKEIVGKSSVKSVYGDMAFATAGGYLASFEIEEALRKDAVEAIDGLNVMHIPIDILSGDRESKVSRIADQLNIRRFISGSSPSGKMEHIQDLQNSGKVRVLMIGDGINDAPSLALSHASMAPASASDIGRNTADFIFTRNDLMAIPDAIAIAKSAGRLIRQNFALAIAYNCIAVPLAFTGHVSPLFAAIAMSASSLVVIVNSMRLRWQKTSRNLHDTTVSHGSVSGLKPAFGDGI